MVHQLARLGVRGRVCEDVRVMSAIQSIIIA